MFKVNWCNLPICTVDHLGLCDRSLNRICTALVTYVHNKDSNRGCARFGGLLQPNQTHTSTGPISCGAYWYLWYPVFQVCYRHEAPRLIYYTFNLQQYFITQIYWPPTISWGGAHVRSCIIQSPYFLNQCNNSLGKCPKHGTDKSLRPLLYLAELAEYIYIYIYTALLLRFQIWS